MSSIHIHKYVGFELKNNNQPFFSIAIIFRFAKARKMSDKITANSNYSEFPTRIQFLNFSAYVTLRRCCKTACTIFRNRRVYRKIPIVFNLATPQVLLTPCRFDVFQKCGPSDAFVYQYLASGNPQSYASGAQLLNLFHLQLQVSNLNTNLRDFCQLKVCF